MYLLNYLNTLEQMDYLIRTGSTGSPEDFAGRLAISVRTLYNYISVLKELGAPVKYSRHKESYIYEYSGKLSICFKSPETSIHVL